ncbi:MAG TPA: nitroreductase [Betaproteobacteria bacterium]|nr:nitroreductase [Betaproteobacteria bacterium]
MTHKPAQTTVPIHETIANRWSGRAFDAARPVNREQKFALMEAARWAPSCFGDEPWRFIVWDRHHDGAAWDKAFDCLGEWNQQWVKNAALLLLATADSRFRKNGKPNAWGAYDTGAASENLCLQAAAMGLVAHQMGGFDPDKTRRTFAIPEPFQCMAMIAVGHPAPADTLNQELKDAELAPRMRQPLTANFFAAEWGRPVDA